MNRTCGNLVHTFPLYEAIKRRMKLSISKTHKTQIHYSPSLFFPFHITKPMKNFAVTVVCIFVVATTVVLLNGACPAAAQTTCDPAQLGTSCGPAFFSSTTQPTTRCCNKLREQQPCYCAYLRNPQLKPLVDSAAARRIAKACKIQFPTQADCPN